MALKHKLNMVCLKDREEEGPVAARRDGRESRQPREASRAQVPVPLHSEKGRKGREYQAAKSTRHRRSTDAIQPRPECPQMGSLYTASGPAEVTSAPSDPLIHFPTVHLDK